MREIEGAQFPLSLGKKVDPAHSALVVIDLQNDFCHRDGVFGRLGVSLETMPGMLRSVGNLVAEARRLDIMIVWVRATYDPVVRSPALEDTLSRPGLTADVCLERTWGAEWVDGFGPNPDAANEVCLTKHRFSAFWDTAIDLFLRSNRISTVLVTGVVTSGCVESTARDAFFRNYFVVMPSDTSASYSQERHEASLRKMAHSIGDVPTSEQVMSIWREFEPGPRNWHIQSKQASVKRDLAEVADPRHTAFVIVDMQNDFCHPDGGMAQRDADISANIRAIPAVRGLLDLARRTGILVIHVHGNYGPLSASSVWIGGDTEASVALEICQPGTWGAQSVAELAPTPDEPIVIKHRYSAFVDTRLETLLRSNGIETLVVTGTATTACVESTVRDAMMRDYEVVVPREAVAARGNMKHLHEASLEAMDLYFARVVGGEQLAAAWAAREAVAG
ncbi:MAG: cysteine hydrolase [Rhodospirillaceae bacterium]|nr:cysteine hydrolase [Rhodospirillaceae bacterium]